MIRRQIQKELKYRGLSCRPAAATYLESVLSSCSDASESLSIILQRVKAESTSTVVDLALLKSIVEDLAGDENETSQLIQVLNACDITSFRWNSARNKFFASPSGTCPFTWMSPTGLPEEEQQVENTERTIKKRGDTEERARDATETCAVWRERYLSIKQRVLRHKSFAPPLLSRRRLVGGGRKKRESREKNYIELTQIESLVATEGGTQYVLGLLSRLSDSRLYLEDLNGKVPLDLSEVSSEVGEGLIVEGCFVLVEGRLSDGVFIAEDIHLPPGEPRIQSLNAHGGLDFLRGGKPLLHESIVEQEKEEKKLDHVSFAVLSDVFLDEESTWSNLELLLQGFSDLHAEPTALILLGNFSSKPFGQGHGQCSAREFTANFERLAHLLSQYPTFLESSTLILIPGPRDPGTLGLLPQSCLPKFIMQPFLSAIKETDPNAKVHLASNPCRIKYLSQELVFFREDMVAKMRRHSVLSAQPTTHKDGDDVDIADRLCHTLVSQSHLCPLPLSVRPIVGRMDAAFRLYPLPHLVVVGDRYDQYRSAHPTGTTMVNPGTFSLDSSFLVYYPATRETQFSRVSQDADSDAMDIDDEHDESSDQDNI